MASSRQSKSAGSAGPTGQAETCPQCGKRLAADQRYCVNCGHRRGEPRVDVDRYLASEDAQASADGRAAAPATRQWSPLLAVVVLALLAGMLLVGVLIGKNSSDDNGTTTTTTTTASDTGTAPATPPATTAATPTAPVPTTTAPAAPPAGGAGTANGATTTAPSATGGTGKVKGK